MRFEYNRYILTASEFRDRLQPYTRYLHLTLLVRRGRPLVLLVPCQWGGVHPSAASPVPHHTRSVFLSTARRDCPWHVPDDEPPPLPLPRSLLATIAPAASAAAASYASPVPVVCCQRRWARHLR